jgi:hypothetical protein
MSIYDRLNGNGQQMTMQQLQSDPVSAAKQAGYNIPQNIAGNPQAMVQHLIQTGQISNPMMQKILPMMQRFGLK